MASRLSRPAWLELNTTQAYVIPFFAYLLGTAIAGRFYGDAYAIAYAAVVIVLGVLLWVLLWGRDAIRPHLQILPGIVVGLLGICAWIAISSMQLERLLTQYFPEFLRPGERVSYNPFEQLSSTAHAWLFIVFRLVGLAIIVPLAEELFWRGFLLRWLISPDWEDIPLGQFSWASFAVVTGLFTLAHPEWFAAAIYCAAINGLLYWTRDLWQCIVAHSVSNLALGIYILASQQWWLW